MRDEMHVSEFRQRYVAGWSWREVHPADHDGHRVEAHHLVAIAAISSRNFAISSRFGP